MRHDAQHILTGESNVAATGTCRPLAPAAASIRASTANCPVIRIGLELSGENVTSSGPRYTNHATLNPTAVDRAGSSSGAGLRRRMPSSCAMARA